MGKPWSSVLMPCVPRRPEINTRSAVRLAPNNGNICISPSFLDISAITVLIVAASVIMQKVPIGRTRAIHRETHCGKSAL